MSLKHITATVWASGDVTIVEPRRGHRYVQLVFSHGDHPSAVCGNEHDEITVLPKNWIAV